MYTYPEISFVAPHCPTIAIIKGRDRVTSGLIFLRLCRVNYDTSQNVVLAVKLSDSGKAFADILVISQP